MCHLNHGYRNFRESFKVKINKAPKERISLFAISAIIISLLTGCFEGRYRQPAHDLAKMLGTNSANILMDFDASGFDVFDHYLIFKPGKELTTVDIANAVRLFNPKALFGEIKPASLAIYAEPIQKFSQNSTPPIKEAKIIGGDLMRPGVGNKSWEISWSNSKGQSTHVFITFAPYSPSTGILEIDGATVAEVIVVINVV